MCTYLYAVLPPGAELTEVESLLESNNLDFGTRGAGSPVPQGRLVRATRNWCDCSSVIGSQAHPRPHARSPEEEISKLRRKGWSEAKITRWLSSKHTAAEAREQRQAANNMTKDQELAMWLAVLPAVVRGARLHSLGLVHHFHSRNETVSIQREERVPVESLCADLLVRMHEDVLYLITP
jgi:hypothetical protein